MFAFRENNPSGTADSGRRAGWYGRTLPAGGPCRNTDGEVLRNQRSDIRPGDEIMVMPKVPVKDLQIAKTLTQMIFQIAVSAGVALGF